MALIKCSECGKEVSDKATACPNCGCPISVTCEEKTRDEDVSNLYENVFVSNKKRKKNQKSKRMSVLQQGWLSAF